MMAAAQPKARRTRIGRLIDVNHYNSRRRRHGVEQGGPAHADQRPRRTAATKSVTFVVNSNSSYAATGTLLFLERR